MPRSPTVTGAAYSPFQEAPVRRMERNAALCRILIATMLSILCFGCGSNNPPNHSMSPAQSQAVSDQIVQALTQALGSAVSSNPVAVKDLRPSLSSAVNDLRPDASSGCTSTSTGENCNFPISLMNDPCSGPQGGTISVTGDVDGTLNTNDSGSLGAQFTITPTNCSVSNLIINGDPNIGVGGQINFNAGLNPAFPFTFTETGGISYGPNPSGTCQLNVTYSLSSLSSCTVTGTVCGQSVNGSC
jgi:hypothetical protein